MTGRVGAAAPDPDAVVGAAWPLHGPYGEEHTVTAARAVAELVRYLNYATRAVAGLPEPGSVYYLLGALTRALQGLPQALDQVVGRFAELAADPGAAIDDLGHPMSRQAAAAVVGAELAVAVSGVAAAAQHLATAHSVAGRLYLAAGNNDDVSGGEW
jgi:hypothetical protein